MPGNFNLHIEVNGGKEFMKVLEEYKSWNKKQISEIINSKLYFITLQAMRNTKMADKSNIERKLKHPSRVNENIPLVNILVNKELSRKGKPLLSGSSARMSIAVEKYIKRAQSKTQFLRSGWLPSLKILNFYNKKGDISFTKRFAPKQPNGIKQYGKDKGSCTPARLNNVRAFGKISNDVGKGRQDSPTVTKLLLEGLNFGINAEIRSMRTYIERKYKEYHDKFNRRNTIP